MYPIWVGFDRRSAMKPSAASHQMCHTSAKPASVQKAPITTPAAVLRGMWMSA